MWAEFRSLQPNAEFFSPGTLVFLNHQNRLPGNCIWVSCCAPGINHGPYGGHWSPFIHTFGPIPLGCVLRNSVHKTADKGFFLFVSFVLIFPVQLVSFWILRHENKLGKSTNAQNKTNSHNWQENKKSRIHYGTNIKPWPLVRLSRHPVMQNKANRYITKFKKRIHYVMTVFIYQGFQRVVLNVWRHTTQTPIEKNQRAKQVIIDESTRLVNWDWTITRKNRRMEEANKYF